ncbi:Bromodomain containing protein 7 [Saguinus oedipus]|uniref:Bromodomain containing protein 7 n=1 Tax=Saguinus oedipus TaxID=9490 RepID=A0ABQ9UKJ6_SAGOE|nr:Bromodomain containing protein 7 [Saguinus oedipus]
MGKTLIFQADFSNHEFLATCQDYPSVTADRLPDVLTKGGHSRTLQELEMSSPEDEDHTGTLDTAKEMEITEIEAAGVWTPRQAHSTESSSKLWHSS